MDISSELFVTFPQWAESSLEHPVQKQSLYSSVVIHYSLLSHASHGRSPPVLPSPSSNLLPHPVFCLFSQGVFCPLNFTAHGLACWVVDLAH